MKFLKEQKNKYEQKNSWRDSYVPLEELSEFSEEYYEACEECDELPDLDNKQRKYHIRKDNTGNRYCYK